MVQLATPTNGAPDADRRTNEDTAGLEPKAEDRAQIAGRAPPDGPHGAAIIDC